MLPNLGKGTLPRKLAFRDTEENRQKHPYLVKTG